MTSGFTHLREGHIRLRAVWKLGHDGQQKGFDVVYVFSDVKIGRTC